MPQLATVCGLIFVALLFDYINGVHDAANSMATVVSTRVLARGKAVIGTGVGRSEGKRGEEVEQRRRSTRDPDSGTGQAAIRLPALRGLFLGVLVVVTGGLVLSACSQEYPAVVRAKLATVPIGDTVDVLSEPVRENLTLRFTWNVETHFNGAQYLDWVTASLMLQGFTVQQRKERSLTLSKLDEGDAYSLNVEVTQEHPTRVKLTITASPA